MQGNPPWNDNNDDYMENEEEMQGGDFVGTDSGVVPQFDHGWPAWGDSNQMENEGNVQEKSLEDSGKARGDNGVTTTLAAVTENNVSSSTTATVGEKRVRKSRWSSVPPDVAEQQSSSQPSQDSASTDVAECTVNDSETARISDAV